MEEAEKPEHFQNVERKLFISNDKNLPVPTLLVYKKGYMKKQREKCNFLKNTLLELVSARLKAPLESFRHSS